MHTQHYIVDRHHPLPPDYVPPDLEPAPILFLCPPKDEKRLMCSAAGNALLNLYIDSLKAGLQLYGISGYRSYKRQKEIYLSSIIKNGVDHTKRFIAAPGLSEHQTGFAIDLSCPEINYELVEEFENTREGKWIYSNAKNYGFRMSYPDKNHSKDGYSYEPWHLCFTCKSAKFYVY